MDVAEDEPRRAAERVLDRHSPPRDAGPARGVVAQPARAEPLAQRLGELGDLFGGNVERLGHCLSGQVVGCPPEAAGHDDDGDVPHLRPQEPGDLLHRVPQRDEEPDLEPQLRKSAREPRRVRVLDVTEDDLVADGEHGRGRRRRHAREYRTALTTGTTVAPSAQSTTLSPP